MGGEGRNQIRSGPIFPLRGVRFCGRTVRGFSLFYTVVVRFIFFSPLPLQARAHTLYVLLYILPSNWFYRSFVSRNVSKTVSGSDYKWRYTSEDLGDCVTFFVLTTMYTKLTPIYARRYIYLVVLSYIQTEWLFISKMVMLAARVSSTL
jgi:hypothetical protein